MKARMRKPPMVTVRPPRKVPAALLQVAVEYAHDGIVITDARLPDNPIIYVNPSFEKMTGYSSRDVIGTNCRFLQGPEVRQEGLTDLRRALKEHRGCIVTLRNYRRDGEMFWNELSIAPMFGADGRVSHYVGIQKDVSLRVRAVDQIVRYQEQLTKANRALRQLAVHDELTRLYNRRHFGDSYTREWRRSSRERRSLAILMFDIDHFKEYNDTYGHIEGDKCLRAVAEALRSTMRRPADMVARYGGEEFVVMAPGLGTRRALMLAESIRRTVGGLGLEHRGSHVAPVVTVSAGVASVVPSSSFRPDQLLDMADKMLYRAKRQGRNQAVAYSSSTRSGRAK